MDDRLSAETVRSAIMALSEGDKEVSHALLYDALGVKADVEKGFIRKTVSKMSVHGEITRTERGTYKYNFKHRGRKNTYRDALWRFVRASKPGWTLGDCALMTMASYSYAAHYVAWLEAEGFVVRTGRNSDNSFVYQNTAKARSHPETPYPPVKETDPFAREKVAAATITRLMLCANPYAAKTARDICQACKVLMARFEKNNNPENMEEDHVE